VGNLSRPDFNDLAAFFNLKKVPPSTPATRCWAYGGTIHERVEACVEGGTIPGKPLHETYVPTFRE
jgi:hypothetical protein